MKFKFLIFFLISTLIVSCSKDEVQEQSSENLPPETEEGLKFISKIEGSDNTIFLYRDNLLVKGWNQNNGVFFEVEYNSQRKVEKVFTCNCGNSLYGLNLNIREDFPDSFLTFEYFYSNGRLSEIRSPNGKVLISLQYNGNNQVTEHYSAIRYCDDYDYYERTKYLYNSSGRIESYISFESFSEQTLSGRIEVDNKINPLNVIWMKFGLIIPEGISQISTYNIPFLSNNVISIYNLNDMKSNAIIKYVDNYPVFYKEISNQGDGTIITYR